MRYPYPYPREDAGTAHLEDGFAIAALGFASCRAFAGVTRKNPRDWCGVVKGKGVLELRKRLFFGGLGHIILVAQAPKSD